MKILNVAQGTEEWQTARGQHRTASEAPVMMGASKKMSRNDLLKARKFGLESEHSRWVVEVLFQRGHDVEAAARPMAEKILGEELFPATVADDDGYLLASLDGMTMAGDVTWECKQWNAKKAAAVRAGEIPEEDRWQIVQQLVVSNAKHCLYMVTDGTPEKCVHAWIALDPADAAHLMKGWQQFDEDLATFELPAQTEAPVGAAPEQLPALRIEVTGAVTASNLTEFRERALQVFKGIRTDLTTDQDFADADQTVKWCKEIEDRLEAAKQHALSQTESIDELFRTIDAIKEEARQKRLTLDKAVKRRKEEVRADILDARHRAFREHVERINARISPARLPEITPNFAGAMKGKKTVSSLESAADDELARAKIEANEWGERIGANLKAIADAGDDYQHLFRGDLQSLVVKDPDDLPAILKGRIAEHDEREAKRLEQERERIRQEEAARLEREQEAARRDEAKRLEQEAREAGEAARKEADAPEPAQPTPATTQEPLTLRDELRAWQSMHHVSYGAMRDLWALLERHITVEEQTA